MLFNPEHQLILNDQIYLEILHNKYLPGLNNALSIDPGLLVAAIIMTFFRDSNPSISVNNWINTLSYTSVYPYLYGAMASISSKNITEGAQILAFLNISLTVFSLSPTYLLNISGPLTAIKDKLHWVHNALANNVFEHPGGPYNKIPFDGYTPSFLNYIGYFSGHSTTLLTSCFISS